MGKRANGEGSIYQRKDGRWAASVSVGGMKRKHFLGHSRAEVSAKLNDALKCQQDGLPIRFERKNFAEYAKGWLESVEPSLKPRTWTRYEQLLRCHAVPALGKASLEKVKPPQLQSLYAQLLKAGQAPSSVRQLHAVLHKALGQAALWGLVPRNVADAVTPPKPRREEMKVLSPEEARRFLAACQGDRFEALFVLAITTGMRQGELLGLTWQNVDLDRGTVQVQRSLQRTKDGFVFTEPKTSRSRRQIVLSGLALDALKKHRIDQAAERLVRGGSWQDMNLVFPNLMGSPLESSYLLRQRFHPLLGKASLPRIRFHDLRHTAATLMLAQGIHPKVVSEMLGHSSIAITLDLYSHVSPTMQVEASRAVEALLRP